MQYVAVEYMRRLSSFMAQSLGVWPKPSHRYIKHNLFVMAFRDKSRNHSAVRLSLPGTPLNLVGPNYMQRPQVAEVFSAPVKACLFDSASSGLDPVRLVLGFYPLWTRF